MPRKKDATKTKKNLKKVDNEEKQEIEQKENKPIPLFWNKLEDNIGKPIWDSREKKWRILDGYKRKRKYIFGYFYRYCRLGEL